MLPYVHCSSLLFSVKVHDRLKAPKSTGELVGAGLERTGELDQVTVFQIGNVSLRRLLGYRPSASQVDSLDRFALRAR